MATLTIRNLDDDVAEKFKARAKAHNRSLEAEVRATLAEAASRLSPAELRAHADRIAERIAAATPGVVQTDSTKLIREDRDR